MRPLAPLFALALAACTQTPQPVQPEKPLPTPDLAGEKGVVVDKAGPTGDPFALTGLVREEALPLLKGPQPAFADVKLAAAPKGVSAAPKTCDAFVKRASKQKATCGDKAKVLEALDAALRVEGADARDEALVPLEACAELPAGLVRSVRVELAPMACGDTLVTAFFAKKPENVPGAINHALIGQALAARLHRAVQSPPQLKAPFTKQRVTEFVKGPMLKWFTEQAVAVQELAKAGADLGSYGRGVVAIAAGTADLRMVEAVRDVPIPDEFRKDPELANAYYASLDEQLEPRKTRGRDGALAGLREMANAGVIRSERVDTARGLLAKLYGGRRVDSLDAILVLPPPEAGSATVEQRLAAALPTFYSGLVLAPEAAKDPAVLRSLAQKGIPLPQRAALKEAEATLADEARSVYARARLAMGIRYWRAVDFDAAASLLSKTPKDKLSKDDRFVLALAIALRNGPEDVAALMLKNEGFSPGFADVRALDVVATEDAASPIGGLAAFDAGVLKTIAAPRDAEPKYWEGLAARFEKATGMLADPKQKKEADERSKAAAAAAKAIAKAGP
ncbi:MAG: hypothetical protein JNL21_22205 [Myxococcales bacterium]|nr:hypothetical protein [Myxococcales bacterium]